MISEEGGGSFYSVAFSRRSTNIGLSYSYLFVLDTDGKWYEKQGVPVDFNLSYASQTERRLNEDLIFERAVDILTK